MGGESGNMRAMTEYQAISIHIPALNLLTSGARLTVLSAHDRALNLSAPTTEIISVVHPALGNGPAAIVIAEPRPLPWAPGDVVLAGDGRLTAGGVSIRYAGAKPWAPPPAPGGTSPAIGPAIRAVAALGSRAGLLPAALAALQYEVIPRPAGLAGALFELAMAGIEALRRGAWEMGARRLAGLGPGLTPSGDDLLCGFLVCLHRAGSLRTEGLAHAVGGLPATATTPISRHFLRWACLGVAGEHHLTWLDSLLAGGGQAHLGPLLAHGATSGADWAAGALLAAATSDKGD